MTKQDVLNGVSERLDRFAQGHVAIASEWDDGTVNLHVEFPNHMLNVNRRGCGRALSWDGKDWASLNRMAMSDLDYWYQPSRTYFQWYPKPQMMGAMG